MNRNRNFKNVTQSRFELRSLPGTYVFGYDQWGHIVAKGPAGIELKPTLFFRPDMADDEVGFELSAYVPKDGNAPKALFVEPTNKIDLGAGVWTSALEAISGLSAELIFQEVPDRKNPGRTFIRAFTKKGGHLVTPAQNFKPKLGQKAVYVILPDREGISAKAVAFAEEGGAAASDEQLATKLGELMPSSVKEQLLLIEVQRVRITTEGKRVVTERRSPYAEIGIPEDADRQTAVSILGRKIGQVRAELQRLRSANADMWLVKKYELWEQNLLRAWDAIVAHKRGQQSENVPASAEPPRRNRRHPRPSRKRQPRADTAATAAAEVSTTKAETEAQPTTPAENTPYATCAQCGVETDSVLPADLGPDDVIYCDKCSEQAVAAGMGEVVYRSNET